MFKAHRLLYHSTLGLRRIKKKKMDGALLGHLSLPPTLSVSVSISVPASISVSVSVSLSMSHSPGQQASCRGALSRGCSQSHPPLSLTPKPSPSAHEP